MPSPLAPRLSLPEGEADRTMAKSTTRKKPTPSPKPPAARLAQIDADLLALIQQRASLVAEAAAQSANEVGSMATLDAEAARLGTLIETAGGPLPPRIVRAIFREIQSGCRALVRQPRIAFLGPLYSYSHLAAMHRFGRSVQLVPVGTIAAVFEEVHQGHADFGLVPVENSTDGRIADTLAMFTRLPVRICGQVEIYIHHSLLAKCSRAEVKEVYSRPQAISQCRNWLAKHLPAARTIEVTSTSTAAQLAAEKPGAAAIASPQAGVEYALAVLAENIEDNPENTTRFAVIGGQVPSGPATTARPCCSRSPIAPALGRSDEHFQAQQAQFDLDRVVSHSRHGAGILPVFRGDGGAPERRAAAAGRGRLETQVAAAGDPGVLSRHRGGGMTRRI